MATTGYRKLEAPRTSQPQEVVGIDWNNPITAGLKGLLWTGPGRPRDLVNNLYATNVLATPTASTNGIAQVTDLTAGSGISFDRLANQAWYQTNSLTYLNFGNLTANGIGSRWLGGVSDNASGRGYKIYDTYGTRGRLARIYVGGVNKEVLNANWADADCVRGLTYDGAFLTGYDNGVSFGSVAATGAISYDPVYTRVFSGSSPELPPQPTSFYWSACWDRALSDAEIKSLNDNPWQLFEPQQIYLPKYVSPNVPGTKLRKYELPWTTQPQGGVRLNYDSDLAKVLTSAWIPTDAGGRDVFGKLNNPHVSGVSIQPTVNGPAWVGSTTTSTRIFRDSAVGYPYVQVAYGKISSVATTQSILSGLSGGQAVTFATSVIRVLDSTTVGLSIFDGGIAEGISVILPSTIDTPLCAVAVVYSATDYRLFVNGQFAASDSSILSPSSLVKVYAPGSQIDGELYFTGFGSGKALTDEQALELSARPELLWNLFEPQQIALPRYPASTSPKLRRIVETTRTTQPQEPVGINYSNELAAKLTAFFLPLMPLGYDAVQKKAGSFHYSGAGYSTGTGVLGKKFVYTNTNDDLGVTNSGASPLTNMTVAAILDVRSLPTQAVYVVNGDTTVNIIMSLGINSNGTLFLANQRYSSGTIDTVTSTYAIAPGLHVLCATFDSSIIKIYDNGTLVYTTTSVTTAIAFNGGFGKSFGPKQYGNPYQSGLDNFGVIGYNNRTLNEREVAILSANPWQILEPEQVLVPKIPSFTVSAKLRKHEMPRTSQPQEVVGIDWNNPITQGLAFAAIGSTGIDHVSGVPATLSGSWTKSTGTEGVAFKGPPTQSPGYWLFPIFIPSSFDCTTIIVTRGYVANVVSQTVPTVFFSSTEGVSFSTSASQSVYSTTGNQSTILTGLTAGQTYVLAGVKRINSQDQYLNGVYQNTSVTGNRALGDITAAYIGRAGVGNNFQSQEVYAVLHYTRALSAHEIAIISADPWQVFEPQQVYTPAYTTAKVPTVTKPLRITKTLLAPTSQIDGTTRLNYNNPLTQGMTMCLVGTPGQEKDLANPGVTVFKNTEAVQSSCELGSGLASGGLYTARNPGGKIQSTGMYHSVFFVGSVTPLNAADRGMCGTGFNQFGGICLQQSYIGPATTMQARMRIDGVSSAIYVTDAAKYPEGFGAGVHGVVLNGNTTTLYRNGVAIKSQALSGTSITYDTNFGRAMLLYYSSGDNIAPIGGTGILGLAWNRALSPEEVASLTANPWQIFEPVESFAPVYTTGYASIVYTGIPVLSALEFLSASSTSARYRVQLTF